MEHFHYYSKFIKGLILQKMIRGWEEKRKGKKKERGRGRGREGNGREG